MFSSGGDDLRGADFEAALKADRAREKAEKVQEERIQHRRASHSSGIQLFQKSMRRFRSQRLWLGFRRWDRWNQSAKRHEQKYNEASPDTKRKLQILSTVNEVQRIAQQSADDLKVEERNQQLKLDSAEAVAAAEAAANPVNALAVLQQKLASLFSDGAKRKSRLRRLHNLIKAASRGDADRVA